MRIFLRTILMLGLTVVPAYAKDVTGTATISGRTVTLFSDQTWEYATVAPTNCSTVNENLQFCGDTSHWKFTPTANPMIAAQYQYDAAHYGEYIFERLGTSNGLSVAAMAKIALQTAATAAQINARDVTVIEQTDVSFQGEPATTIVYSLAFQGLPVVFANTILVRGTYTVQIVTYAIAPDYTATHRDLHAEFLQNSKVL